MKFNVRAHHMVVIDPKQRCMRCRRRTLYSVLKLCISSWSWPYIGCFWTFDRWRITKYAPVPSWSNENEQTLLVTVDQWLESGRM